MCVPKIFKNKDRIRIKYLIIKEAHKLFSVNGFLKTSVEQITSAVGIAQGTFYNFFKSKEALFFEIMGEMEQEKFKMIDEVFTKNGDPVEELNFFLKRMFNNVASDPIFHWLYKERLFERIVSKISYEEIEKHMRYDIEAANKILASVQSRGILGTISCDEFVSHLRALFMVTLHKEELGVYDFKVFMEKHIDLFIEGILSVYGGKNDKC